MGNLMAAEYEVERQVGDVIKSASMARFETNIATLEPSKDTITLAEGGQTFKMLCAPCHASDGGGLVGPNLCDDYWIHGGQFSDNIKTIWNGVPEKGMITWKNNLNPKQILAVASYVHTLRGTSPKKPKPPENQAPVKTGPSEFE
jgi:cytochrome c oxidase cbb3-type subunit 3